MKICWRNGPWFIPIVIKSRWAHIQSQGFQNIIVLKPFLFVYKRYRFLTLQRIDYPVYLPKINLSPLFKSLTNGKAFDPFWI